MLPGKIARIYNKKVVRALYQEEKKKKMAAKPNVGNACKKGMTVGNGKTERGQRNKQSRIEEEANQLYRQPQMTEQAGEEEEEE